MHAVLLHAETVAAAIGSLGLVIEEWGTVSFKVAIIRPQFHWYAVLLRGLCFKGNRPHNVSLEGLLAELQANPGEVLIAARPRELQRLIGRPPTQDLVLAKVTRDLRTLKRVAKPVRAYANSVAHLQLREMRLRGHRLRMCREKARQLVDEYQTLLSRKRFSYEARDHWVDRFETDLARLSPR